MTKKQNNITDEERSQRLLKEKRNRKRREEHKNKTDTINAAQQEKTKEKACQLCNRYSKRGSKMSNKRTKQAISTKNTVVKKKNIGNKKSKRS